MFSSIGIRFTIDEYESCVQYIFSTIRYLRIAIIDISITIQRFKQIFTIFYNNKLLLYISCVTLQRLN